MALSDLIQISISVVQARTLGTGFGVPLVFSTGASWSGTRSYSSAAGVSADFAVTTPEYLAASAMFAQNPSVPLVKIGQGTHKATQQYTMIPIYADSTVYALTIVDTAGVAHVVSVTSGVGSNLNTLIGQLKTAIDALSLALTTANVGGTSLTITANTAGAYWSIWPSNVALMGSGQTNADPGIATDLAALNLLDPAWYGLITLFQSQLIIQAAAAWVQSNSKLYIAASGDTTIPTTTKSGGTDVASVTQSNAYTRTAILYHLIPGQFADAAWMGGVFPLISGSETWAYKTLVGVTVDTLTETWRTNILAKSANCYEQIGNTNITEMGTCASGQYIDVTRFIDWLTNDMSTRIFNVLAQAGKDPYTDAGIANIQAAVLASLKAGVNAGGLVKGSTSCSVPLAASASPTDKANRNLSNVTFAGQLAGAIHTVTTIQGTITT